MTAFAPEAASYMVETVADTGGAHPNTFLQGVTFGSADGKPTRLTWPQICLLG